MFFFNHLNICKGNIIYSFFTSGTNDVIKYFRKTCNSLSPVLTGKCLLLSCRDIFFPSRNNFFLLSHQNFSQTKQQELPTSLGKNFGEPWNPYSKVQVKGRKKNVSVITVRFASFNCVIGCIFPQKHFFKIVANFQSYLSISLFN